LNARQYIQSQIDQLVAEARPIAQKAESEGRALTTSERAHVKSRIDLINKHKEELAELDANQAILDALGMSDRELGGTSENGAPVAGSLWLSAKARGAKAEKGQVIRVTASGDARGTKGLLLGEAGSVVTDAQDNTPPRYEPGVRPLQISARYAYPVFPSSDIAMTEASVSWLQQTDRDLATTDVMRDFASKTTKPVTTSEVTLQNSPSKLFATMTNPIPLALFERTELRDIVDADCRLALSRTLDDYVVDAILADPDSSIEGADIIEQVVHAKQKLADAGFSPSVTLMSSSDYTELTLARSPTTGEFYANVPALGDVRVCDQIQDGQPVVLDPAGFGRLYIGGTAVDVDGISGFEENTARLRFEFPGFLAIYRPKAACLITASSA
jgi:hypothetical protein